jgi:hypothetical protein
MTREDIETIYDVKMTNQELMEYFKPDNIPRIPTNEEIEDIMNSGMDEPLEYILTWFFDKGGEGDYNEIEGEYDDI